MTTDDTGRASPHRERRPEGLPTGDESPREIGGTVARGLLGALFGRVFFFEALVWLLLGGGLLTGAWVLIDGELGRRAMLVEMSGRAEGVVEAPWWRVEADPEVLGDGTNWLAVTEASACARLRFRPEGGEEEVLAPFCRRFRGGVRNAYFFTWGEALGPVPVRWVDGRGMPRIELQLDSRLVRWLDERGPEVHRFYDLQPFHGPESARRADRLLGDVWRDLDDPFLRLLEAWSAPEPVVTIAYRPDDPSRAVPLPLIESAAPAETDDSPFPGWWLAVPFGFFGLLAWGAGSYLLIGHRPWAVLSLIVVMVVALPWVTGSTAWLLGHLGSGPELAFRFIETDMLGLPPALELAVPEDDGEDDATRLSWTLARSTYAPLLHWIDLTPPPETTDSDGVLRHLAHQVRRQAVALPDPELAALLAWAASVQSRGAGEELGLLFVDTALGLKDDAERSEDVRHEAEQLLRAVGSHEPSDNPHRLAVEERKRILARLPG